MLSACNSATPQLFAPMKSPPAAPTHVELLPGSSESPLEEPPSRGLRQPPSRDPRPDSAGGDDPAPFLPPGVAQKPGDLAPPPAPAFSPPMVALSVRAPRSPFATAHDFITAPAGALLVVSVLFLLLGGVFTPLTTILTIATCGTWLSIRTPLQLEAAAARLRLAVGGGLCGGGGGGGTAALGSLRGLALAVCALAPLELVVALGLGLSLGSSYPRLSSEDLASPEASGLAGFSLCGSTTLGGAACLSSVSSSSLGAGGGGTLVVSTGWRLGAGLYLMYAGGCALAALCFNVGVAVLTLRWLGVVRALAGPLPTGDEAAAGRLGAALQAQPPLMPASFARANFGGGGATSGGLAV